MPQARSSPIIRTYSGSRSSKRALFHGSFSIKLKAGALFSHEWRDNSNPYNTGPSLRIDAEGCYTHPEAAAVCSRANTWVRFDIVCEIGDAATGIYTLVVNIPDSKPVRYADLLCSARFKKNVDQLIR